MYSLPTLILQKRLTQQDWHSFGLNQCLLSSIKVTKCCSWLMMDRKTVPRQMQIWHTQWQRTVVFAASSDLAQREWPTSSSKRASISFAKSMVTATMELLSIESREALSRLSIPEVCINRSMALLHWLGMSKDSGGLVKRPKSTLFELRKNQFKGSIILKNQIKSKVGENNTFQTF